MSERLIPQSVEAEAGVLGSIIIDPAAFDLVADSLVAGDFYRDAHRTIYEAICSLVAERIEPDYLTVCDELARHNKLEQVGGQSYISWLMGEVPTSGNVVYYASIVARTAVLRRLIHAAGQIAASAYNQDENALEIAEKALFEVQMGHVSSDFSFASEIVDEVLEDLEALHSREKSLVGVPTGFKAVDYYLGGMQRSDLIILAARPAMGKSSYMLSVAYNAVFDHDQRVGVFSLEMSRKQLMQRLLSYDTGIPLYRLRNGHVEDDEWELLLQSRHKLATDKLAIDETGGITLSSLRNKARRLKAKQGLDLIIVDYLQLMHTDSTSRDRNREQEVAEISAGLKELAKELDIPVLALAQLSRAVEGRQDKRPQLSDLRESGSIENNADVIKFIYRDKYYNPQTERGDWADIIIAKHRNGPVGTVDLIFNASKTRFEELSVEAAS